MERARHNWTSEISVKQGLQLSRDDIKNCISKVCSIIINGSWCIPLQVKKLFQAAGINVDILPEPDTKEKDYVVWTPDDKGALAWKLCHHVAATEVSAQRKGVKLASRCPCCCNHVEDINHASSMGMPFRKRSMDHWKWIAAKSNVTASIQNLQQAKSKLRARSPIITFGRHWLQ
ncbi:hypothetical protein IFM89_021302, partial [Coptis chinensis]